MLRPRGVGDRLDDVHVAGAAADVALDRRAGSRARSAPGSGRAGTSRSSASRACSTRTGARGGRRTPAGARVSSPSPARPSTVSIVRAVGLDREHHAALHERPVDEHRAGAAVAGVAADVRAREVERRRAGSGRAACGPRPRARSATPLTSTLIRCSETGSTHAASSCLSRGAHGEHLGEVAPVVGRRVDVRRRVEVGARAPPRARRPRSADGAARSSTGTAATQPSAIRSDRRSRLAAALDDARAVARRS